ncbi:uncharacterized protein At5g43822-like [Chenopodium quinoa]|uniref:uncharacterized protein At5g43822-like n=1 Tax=Chenopodium quinoa TaxID=63459 RepID=UPI000B76FF80|nr:uncharacterized protein At5g43822-like [Chenopodium quinoa]
MENILKKYQQKFKKVREEMDHWEDLQSRLLSQFSNASSVIGRIEVIGNKRNYGGLKGVDGIEDAVLQKQMESLETILLSLKKTMLDFHSIVLSLEKMVRDSRQLVGRGSHVLSTKQLQQRVGIKPSLSDCLDGLAILQEMHSSEYRLKSSVVSALLSIALKPSSKDLGALRQLLFDQPNIPRDEVQLIYDIIFAEDIS